MFAPFITTDFLYCINSFWFDLHRAVFKAPSCTISLKWNVSPSPLDPIIDPKIVLPSVDTDGKSNRI